MFRSWIEGEPALDSKSAENRRQTFKASGRQQFLLAAPPTPPQLSRSSAHWSRLHPPQRRCGWHGASRCGQKLGLGFAGYSDTVDDRERGACLQARADGFEKRQLCSIVRHEMRGEDARGSVEFPVIEILDRASRALGYGRRLDFQQGAGGPIRPWADRYPHPRTTSAGYPDRSARSPRLRQRRPPKFLPDLQGEARETTPRQWQRSRADRE